MKPTVRKDGSSWVVCGGKPSRTVRVGSYEAALVVAAGPTGREKRCAECDRPMGKAKDRPLGVLSQKTARYCGACVHANPALSRESGRKWREQQAEKRAREEAEQKRQAALMERAEREYRLKREREMVARAEQADPALAHYLARRRARLGVAA